MRPRTKKRMPPTPHYLKGVEWQRNARGVLVPGPSKLVYPTPISTGKRGDARSGTLIFVPLGTDTGSEPQREYQQIRKQLDIDRKKTRRPPNDTGAVGLSEFSDRARAQLIAARFNAANKSDYFLKSSSRQQLAIRKKLVEKKILVEFPIEVIHEVQKMSNGKKRTRVLELFKRMGFRNLFDYHYSHIRMSKIGNIAEAVDQIIDKITRLHELGIAHNHPHISNWVIDTQGKIMVIDLSLARIFRQKPRSKRQFLERFGRDILYAAQVATAIQEGPGIREDRQPNRRHMLETNVQRILNAHRKIVPTFGTSVANIYDEVSRQDMEKYRKKLKAKKQ